MNRWVLMIIVLAAAACLVPASGQAKTPVLIGFGFNLNGANVSFDNLQQGEDNSMRWGIALGGRISFPLSSMFAIDSGLNYSMKGTDLTYQGVFVLSDNAQHNLNLTSSEKLGYLTVPIMAKFIIPVTGMVHPYLKAGPEIGICVSKRRAPTEPSTASPIANRAASATKSRPSTSGSTSGEERTSTSRRRWISSAIWDTVSAS